MKQRAKTQPALGHEIVEILKRFNEAEQDFSKLWKIEFKSGDMPTIVGKSDLKPVYKQILKSKIDTEKLEFWRERIQS